MVSEINDSVVGLGDWWRRGIRTRHALSGTTCGQEISLVEGNIMKILQLLGLAVVTFVAYSVGKSRGLYVSGQSHGDPSPPKGFLDSGAWRWLP